MILSKLIQDFAESRLESVQHVPLLPLPHLFKEKIWLGKWVSLNFCGFLKNSAFLNLGALHQATPIAQDGQSAPVSEAMQFHMTGKSDKGFRYIHITKNLEWFLPQ